MQYPKKSLPQHIPIPLNTHMYTQAQSGYVPEIWQPQQSEMPQYAPIIPTVPTVPTVPNISSNTEKQNPMPETTLSQQVLGPKILNHENFDFENSSIIRPDTSRDLDRERSVQKRVTIFTVDSRMREKEHYPTPAKYVIPIEDTIPDVLTAEIVSAHIPFKTYLVNKNNASFEVKSDDPVANIPLTKITLEYGDYTAPELAQEIKRAFDKTMIEMITDNESSISMDFKVEYNGHQDKFVFYSSVPLTFLFERQTLKQKPYNSRKMLGFEMKPYVFEKDASPKHTSMPYVLKAPYRKNFSEQSYVLLKIGGFHIEKSEDKALFRTFALIPENKGDLNIVAHNHAIVKTFNPPLATLSKLQITFVDQNGELADFQNHDHYFTLKLESYKHTRKYATFLDK